MSVGSALAPITGSYDMVYAYDAVNGNWLRYAPDGPPFGNTLNSISASTGLWVRGTQDFDWDLNGASPAMITLALESGWNLISVPLSAPQPVGEVLAELGDRYTLIYGFADGQWQRYAPDGPPFGNTLTTLAPGRGYWIHMVEPAALITVP